MTRTNRLLVVGSIVLTEILFSACGGSGGGSKSAVVRNAVKAAEEAVQTEQSSALGTIPSLQLQYDEAKKALKAHFKEENDALKDKFKDGKSLENVMREAAKLEDARKTAEEELEQVYKEKIIAEASTLAGNAIKVEFDESRYTAANARFVLSPDSSIRHPLTIEAELTLAAPILARYTANCRWEYQNAKNERLQFGAAAVNDFKQLQAGDKVTITKEFPLSAADVKKSNMQAFDHLYFTKDLGD